MSKNCLAVLLFFFLVACSPSTIDSVITQAPLSTPATQSEQRCGLPKDWSIRYNRSGGFAGFNESLTLDSAGRLTVRSERPPIDKQKMITDVQVDAITDLLAGACPFEVPLDRGVCADCFIYDLEIIMGGQLYSMQASDVTLTRELQPLIDALNQFLQASRQ